MIVKKFIFSFIILILFNFNTFAMENIYIVYKINNEIITNIDVDKESKYLITLNKELKNLDKSQLLNISKESILREKIKMIELGKYFDLEVTAENVKDYLRNFYNTLNFNSENEFNQYLESNGLTLENIEKKITIEIYWNQLIYEKYINLIDVDENALKNKIKNIDFKEKIYLLSEILFELENNEKLKTKIKIIEQSINEIGFNNTANIYSISDSSKLGGKLQWIEERKLSKKILKNLNLLSKGQHTAPIQTGSNFIILKVEEIKYEQKKFDEKEMLNRMVEFETNKQLDTFSKIFFKQIKINQKINEF